MNAKPKRKNPETLSEEGRIVLEARYKQLDFLKQRQWTITNYVALIYGALFSVKHLVHSSVQHQDSVLTVLFQDSVLKALALVAGIVGVGCVLTVQKHLRELRGELDKANDWIFGEFKEGDQTERGQIVGRSTGEEGSWRDLPFLSSFLMVLIVGALLCWLFI
jgi:hypothetical protein